MYRLIFEVLLEASAIAMMSYALAVLSRATGVYVLEMLIFATSSALGFYALTTPDFPGKPPAMVFFLWGGLALLTGVAMLYIYRRFRQSRGGEATSLMISFCLMNALAMGATKLTAGRNIPIQNLTDDQMAVVAGVGWLLIVLVAFLGRPTHLDAALKLARDDGAFLASFGLKPRRIHLVVALLSAALVFLGVVLYLGRQDHFGTSRYEAFLIPVFGVALSQLNPKVFNVALIAVGLVGFEEVVRYFGEPTLQRAYQSAVLIILVLAYEFRKDIWLKKSVEVG